MKKLKSIICGVSLAVGLAAVIALAQPGAAEAKASAKLKAPSGTPAIGQVTCARPSLTTAKLGCALKTKAKGKVSGYKYTVSIAVTGGPDLEQFYNDEATHTYTVGKSGKLSRSIKLSSLEDIAIWNGTPKNLKVRVRVKAFSKKGSKKKYGKWSESATMLSKSSDVNEFSGLGQSELLAKAQSRVNDDMARFKQRVANSALDTKVICSTCRKAYKEALESYWAGTESTTEVEFPRKTEDSYEWAQTPVAQFIGSFERETWLHALGDVEDTSNLNFFHYEDMDFPDRYFRTNAGDERVDVLASCLRHKYYEKTDYKLASIEVANKDFTIAASADGDDVVTSRYLARTDDGRSVYLSSALVVLDVE